MMTRSAINAANGARARGGLGGAFWTPTRLMMLDAMWRQGARVADMVALFGDGCTRGMIIGKANRMGLPPHPDSQRARAANMRLKAGPAR